MHEYKLIRSAMFRRYDRLFVSRTKTITTSAAKGRRLRKVGTQQQQQQQRRIRTIISETSSSTARIITSTKHEELFGSFATAAAIATLAIATLSITKDNDTSSNNNSGERKRTTRTAPFSTSILATSPSTTTPTATAAFATTTSSFPSPFSTTTGATSNRQQAEPTRIDVTPINTIAANPKNVMLQRMRSLKARGLNDKYKIDWDTVLGEGAYGSVHPGRLAATGEKVALKKINKQYTDSDEFRAETDALMRIYENGGHPNISGLRDIYEDSSYFYLILDLVSGGEMFDHLINDGAYSEADAARLMHEIASALAFIHGVGVVHSDLKPENLLLCSKKRLDGTIKMIDFGCSQISNDWDTDDGDNDNDVLKNDNDDIGKKIASKSATINNSLSSSLAANVAQTTESLKDSESSSFDTDNTSEKEPEVEEFIGTIAYWAPERFIKGRRPDAACDMWGVGVILYVMLTGVHPFDTMGQSTDEEIEKRILENPRPPMSKEFVGHLSDSAKDLICKLMEPDPEKRLTAYHMLHHPWVRGETALKGKMEDSDKKLSTFKDVRNDLEATFFAYMVNSSHQDLRMSEAKPIHHDDEEEDDSRSIISNSSGSSSSGTNTGSDDRDNDHPNSINRRASTGSRNQKRSSPASILKNAFEVFDEEGKGFITLDDLENVIKKQTGSKISRKNSRNLINRAQSSTPKSDDEKDIIQDNNYEIEDMLPSSNSNKDNKNELSLSDFSKLLSGFNHQYYLRGHTIFKAGDKSKSMFFLNSGKVEIQTRKGQLVSILRAGDFFGEGSLIDDNNTRYTTAKCATPVDVIEIKRKDFDKYIASSDKTKIDLRRKWRARHLQYAKNFLRLQKNVKQKTYKKGDIVYKEGDIGKAMYRVDDVDGGELEVYHDNKVVHRYEAGDSFGETALLFKKPRSSTVKCVSDTCRLNEMLADDFIAVINAFPEMAVVLKNMCRKRLFKKAVKAYSLKEMNRGFTDSDLIAAFEHADKDRTRTLNLQEITAIMHAMDATYPIEEIREFLNFADVDGDGRVSFEEFKALFRQFEHEHEHQHQHGEGLQ